ncbi:Ig-like domain-containing protein [Tepidibacter hydrothermalis]|uniref:Ig-like domain-containing protein n=1 Tax=Tepidibacter hydrothermalis TaxID=3036126 RepID=A0ABY8EC54_9FIRM|nr:Ig-like domain-containing protein [Tepidibacter hydrothermalis]WFD10521.1 Ig-like domain-containing protein [Tepidibacter hydrothermalis]
MRRISLMLIFVMILTIIPIDISNAVGIEDTLTLKSSKESISKNQVGVNYDTTYIDVVYGSNYTKDPSKDINTSIDILVNGTKDDEENYNFSVNLTEHKIRISLNNPSKRLNSSSLYTVHIVAGLFKGSPEINYNFVTKSDNTSQSGIITKTECSGGTITYTFVDDIDDIDFNSNAKDNIQNYITLTSSLVDNLKDDIDNPYVVDDISNYEWNIDADDSKKLIVERIDKGDFKNLSKYIVTLKANSIHLKNADTIYNQQNIVNFSTDDIFSSTDPIDSADNVSTHPTISVKFKATYPIDSNIDKTKVTLISKSGSIHTNVQDYVYVDIDSNSLRIDINNLYTDTNFKLSNDEEYTVKVASGAVSLKGKTDLDGNPYKYNKDITFKFHTMNNKPEVKETIPANNSVSKFDENNLYKDSDGTYYLTAIFDDLDGSIKLYNDKKTPSGFNLHFDGSSEDLIDKTKEIRIEYKSSYKKTYIYIPIKEKLNSNTEYKWYVPENVVENGVDEKGEKLLNSSASFSFSTTPMPTVSRIVDATVGEDYDEDKPIILEGGMFYSGGVAVYFENEFGDKERAERVVIDGNIVKVYLPDGSDRLEPGTYKIIVENDDNHKIIVEFDTISVIKKGEFTPEEDKKVIKDDSKGKVEKNMKVSEDTLILSSSYKSKSTLDLDLDEIMGADSVVRKIKYEGSKSSIYSNLNTKSKYADIDIYNLRPIDYDKDKDVVASLGRVEPLVVDSIKNKLRSAHIVSDFIQVTGDNFTFDNVNIRIPYEYAGENINVLRYDEEMRNWYTVPFSIDRVDKNVYIKSSRKGIFVVVD